MPTINDGRTGDSARVDERFRLRTHAVTEDEQLHATEKGRGFNLSTGLISITGDASLLYLKNIGELDIAFESIIFGMFDGLTHSDDPYLTLIRNPTGGDVITDQTAIALNANRNFGSTDDLDAIIYKGKVGGTITGGSDYGIFQCFSGQRNVFPVDVIIPKGSSIGIKLTANISSGSANCYLASVVFGKEDTSD